VYEKEPFPLKSEIATAVKKLSNGKASGPDGNSAELYKNCGSTAMTEVYTNSVWKLVTGRLIGLNQYLTIYPTASEVTCCYLAKKG